MNPVARLLQHAIAVSTTGPASLSEVSVTSGPRIDAEHVWRALGKASFAVLGLATRDGEPRSSGVVYALVDGRLVIVTAADSWKARALSDGQLVSVTVPIRRGGPLSLLLPIPPATITFRARARVHPPGSVDIGSLSKRLASMVPEQRRSGTVLELLPEGTFLTHGLGVSLRDMRDPSLAAARVGVVERTSGVAVGMRSTGGLSRREAVGLLIHRLLDKWLTPIGVWLFRRTKGAVARPWNVDALLLTTHGRRSGRERTVVLQYFPDGDAKVVTAANDGGDAYPGWYHNLKADPRALIEVDGRHEPVRAEELSADEATEWWERIVERDPSYARYRRATSRPFPILRLVATLPGGPGSQL